MTSYAAPAAITNLPDPMLPEPYRVQRVRKENEETFTVELESTNGIQEFPFAAGQFNMLYVYGVGEVPISISGDPGKPKKLIHTTRAVGTVTGAMQQLKRGDIMGIRGPYGSCWPLAEAEGKDVVFVAGGIGLAPLRPALYHMITHREKYGSIVLLYGTRTPNDILFRSEVERWSARLDIEVYVTVDRAIHPWRGNVGVVTRLIPRAPIDRQNTIAMVCGPEVMMYYTVMELQKRGLPAQRVFVSMERNMKCAVGFCGHCQWGPHFICKDGPVFRFADIKPFFDRREV
jgi:NAD(P)H-flavin reductase